MKTKHRALLGVELFEISSGFINKIRKSNPNPDFVFHKLPKYTINTNEGANNRPVSAYWYHQFIGLLEDENNKYLYFNLMTLDNQLQYEIGNIEIEELFSEIDFKKVLSNFESQKEELSTYILPKINYLVVELTYLTSYDYHNGDYDSDMEVDIIGYLDNNLEYKPI